MEIDGQNLSVVEEGTTGGGGSQIALHPLVILNISDHYTRQKAQTRQGPIKKVAGCIVGLTETRRVEIANSFEVPLVEGEHGGVVMDLNFLRKKVTQFKQVFPQYEVLGWYSTGSGQPSPDDVTVQRSLIDGFVSAPGTSAEAVQEPDPFCDRPVYLRLDTHIDFSSDAKDLPITAYESEHRTDVAGEVPTLLFVPVEAYRLKPESGEAERISVDHISRAGAAAGAGGASTLTTQLGGMRNAISMLNDRIAMLHKYLGDVNNGTVSSNPSILREIASLCSRLPVSACLPSHRRRLLRACGFSTSPLSQEHCHHFLKCAFACGRSPTRPIFSRTTTTRCLLHTCARSRNA
jgi:COP9 signalosome complex subunit 6